VWCKHLVLLPNFNRHLLFEKVVCECRHVLQLQDKATLLTAERKKRGKTIPEGLASAEDIRGYHQVASHVVR